MCLCAYACVYNHSAAARAGTDRLSVPAPPPPPPTSCDSCCCRSFRSATQQQHTRQPLNRPCRRMQQQEHQALQHLSFRRCWWPRVNACGGTAGSNAHSSASQVGCSVIAALLLLLSQMYANMQQGHALSIYATPLLSLTTLDSGTSMLLCQMTDDAPILPACRLLCILQAGPAPSALMTAPNSHMTAVHSCRCAHQTAELQPLCLTGLVLRQQM